MNAEQITTGDPQGGPLGSLALFVHFQLISSHIFYSSFNGFWLVVLPRFSWCCKFTTTTIKFCKNHYMSVIENIWKEELTDAGTFENKTKFPWSRYIPETQLRETNRSHEPSGWEFIFSKILGTKALTWWGKESGPGSLHKTRCWNGALPAVKEAERIQILTGYFMWGSLGYTNTREVGGSRPHL